MSRRTLGLGKSAVSFLSLFIAWSAFWTTLSGTEFASTARAEESLSTRGLAVLAFIDRGVLQNERTTSLIEETRRKNYPIQVVERATRDDALFKQYDVKTTPTFVFLINGKELKRFVVGNEATKEAQDRLAALFYECRNVSDAKKTTVTRGQDPDAERIATSGTQANFARPKYGRTVALPSKSKTPPVANVSANFPVELSSNDSSSVESSVSRPCLTQVRVSVGVRGASEERVSGGVVVHYNEEYGEALTLAPASLFADVADPLKETNITLDIVSSTSNSRERAVGQCVFCDARAGLAFVAARVASPANPVAFLSKNDLPQVGESVAVATFNDNDELVPTKFEIISSDSDSMRLVGGEGRDCYGSGVFLVRNDRLYFSGLFTAIDAEGKGVVAPVSLIERILLANGNLSTVYRDQVSGKYEALSLASFEPLFSTPLPDSASRVDLNDVPPSTNMSDVFDVAEVDANVMNALSKLPADRENIPNDPNLRFDSPNAPTIDSAPVFANSSMSGLGQTSVSNVPGVLKKSIDSSVDAKENTNVKRSVALAANAEQTTGTRVQEIPMASREIGGAFTEMNEIRSTNYASRQNDMTPTTNDQENRLFESSLDELRRLSLEGAEIICIVNWNASPNGTKTRETEVVRLPRRKSVVSSNANDVDVARFSTQTTVERKSQVPNAVPSQTPTITGVAESGLFR